MSNDITIGQAVEAIRKAETEVMTLLQRLHDETGLVVNRVDLKSYRHENIGSDHDDWYITGVDIDARLNA